MAGSGPAPSPTSRRQTGNQAHTWTDLPAEGRQGDAPGWPLIEVDRGEHTDAVALRELEVWRAIWRTPQAVAWDRLGWTHDVALYVRTLVAAELGDLKSTTEARQWSDRLGLNPTAMLKNRWRVRVDEVEERRAAKPKKKRALVAVDDAVARP